MTLQVSGPISLGNVSVELGRPQAEMRNLGGATTRALLSVPSGTISLSTARGKSNLVPFTMFYQNIAASYSYRPASGKGTYWGTAAGYPVCAGRGSGTASINGAADTTVPSAAWAPFVYTVANTNRQAQVVNFKLDWSSGSWDVAGIQLYRTGPQVLMGTVYSASHHESYQAYETSNITATIAANSTWTFQVYMFWQPNGDYDYTRWLSAIRGVTITHVGWA